MQLWVTELLESVINRWFRKCWLEAGTTQQVFDRRPHLKGGHSHRRGTAAEHQFEMLRETQNKSGRGWNRAPHARCPYPFCSLPEFPLSRSPFTQNSGPRVELLRSFALSRHRVVEFFEVLRRDGLVVAPILNNTPNSESDRQTVGAALFKHNCITRERFLNAPMLRELPRDPCSSTLQKVLSMHRCLTSVNPLYWSQCGQSQQCWLPNGTRELRLQNQQLTVTPNRGLKQNRKLSSRQTD